MIKSWRTVVSVWKYSFNPFNVDNEDNAAEFDVSKIICVTERASDKDKQRIIEWS